MSIDRLSSTSSLIAALRSEIARKSDRTRNGGRSDGASRPSSGRDVQSLRRDLAAMVKGVDIEDDAAMTQLRSRVIRAVLLWEFGPQLREYSEWQPMVESLAATLERSDTHRAEFRRMVQDLQSKRA